MGAEYSILAFVRWRQQGMRSYGHAGFVEAQKRWVDAPVVPGTAHPDRIRTSLHGANVIVTGANAGLGYCVAEELARRKACVHLVCRNEERGRIAQQKIVSTTGNDNIVLHICDVSSQQSVRRFADTYCRDYKDAYALINNAGVMPSKRAESADKKELCIATMAGGSFLLTGLLLPALKKAQQGARVVNVSSAGMYSMIVNPDDLNSTKRKYDGARVYAIAKRIQCDITQIWAEEVLGKDSSVKVVSMHPGWADTPGLRSQYPSFYDKNKEMLRTAEEGADTIVWLVCTPEPPMSGQFYFDREVHPTAFRFTRTASSPQTRIEVWNTFCDWYSWGAKLYNKEI